MLFHDRLHVSQFAPLVALTEAAMDVELGVENVYDHDSAAVGSHSVRPSES